MMAFFDLWIFEDVIDGDQLADLMIDYNVGVSPIESYEIKRIDSDYFEEG